ncbi:GNAT family N-acetyltransferase [Actinosynnema sp. NPDC047251]|uniref:GNAT family N-acetyltransferase n=1 Tax=Saccharothrix espanaensis TaxID=103731 RepID=UPI00030FF703|nr:GNAT family N-acetyltransferase [Saccharothrix espanaensis]
MLEVIGEDEWARWRALRLAALLDAPAAFTSTHAEWVGAPEARWRRRVAATHNLVAVLDGADVGMVSAADGDEVDLLSLWVAPAARGRGVGDALVDGVVRWAGTRAVRLEVAAGNARARALYLRHGFVARGARALVRVPA